MTPPHTPATPSNPAPTPSPEAGPYAVDDHWLTGGWVVRGPWGSIGFRNDEQGQQQAETLVCVANAAHLAAKAEPPPSPAPLTVEELARVREALRSCNKVLRNSTSWTVRDDERFLEALALLDRALPKEPKP